MAKHAGKQLLVKISNDTTFDTLCGLTSKTLTVNNNNFDVTTPDCATPGGQLWQELMTGTRSVSVSGNGIFDDGAPHTRFRAKAYGTGQDDTVDALDDFQIVVPGLGTFEGTFHINDVEYGGETEGAVTYGFNLASSGYVSFTAE